MSPAGRTSSAASAVIVATALMVSTLPAGAAQTRRWTESAEHLQGGDADGIAVTSTGKLFMAPRLTLLGKSEATRREAHVWSVAADRTGNIYLGTGPEGRVLKISPSGVETVLFRVDEPMVTAVAVLAGGDLLAGTAPEGRIYRITPDGTGQVWAETGERYVWSLVSDADGTVYAGTGEQGIVFKIAPSGRTTPLFDSDESHIVSLLARPDGSLVAGGAGRGLVYEIDAEGNAFVLHDDELPEVRALAVRSDGHLIAALVGPPEVEARPPAVRIQLPDGSQLGPASESVGDLDDSRGPTVEGTIEGLNLPSETSVHALRGRVVRISPEGGVTELWRSTDEAPYSLALDSEGRALFGTGEPGRLYRSDGDHEVALLASVGEAQVSGLLRKGGMTVVATSNPAAAYRLDSLGSESGEFLSKPLDAGSLSRWGTIRWEKHGSGTRAEFYTRSGNSADPDATWSAWGPALTDAGGSPIVNTDGRFLQWRVRMQGGGGSDVRVSDVTVSYVPYNRPPVLEEFRLHPAATAIAGEGVFRWNASDPDGDPLEVRVEYSAAGSSDWSVAVREHSEPAGPSAHGAWRSGESRWATADISEGAYSVRAVCTDQGGNPPGEGLEASSMSRLSVVIDRTPPQLSVEENGRLLDVVVTDAHSTVSGLQVLLDGEVRFLARATDGVCDSSLESFKLDLTDQDRSAGTWELRAVDAADNSSTVAVPGA